MDLREHESVSTAYTSVLVLVLLHCLACTRYELTSMHTPLKLSVRCTVSFSSCPSTIILSSSRKLPEVL